MNSGKKAFLIFGIPSIVLLALFSIIHFLVTFIAIAISGLVLYFAILNGKWKRNGYVRITKFSMIMMLISLGSFVALFAPHVWLGQFAVNLNKAGLIEPENEKIISLEAEFHDWLENEEPFLEVWDGTVISYDNSANLPLQYKDYTRYYYEINFSEVSFDELTFPQQMFTVDHFVQDIIMDYEYDEDTYGSMEYKATIDEILAEGYESNWETQCQDDCDGSAVVTVSLLQKMGYNAFIGSGKSHWFTVVEPRAEDDFDRTVFVNTWRSIHVFYYFNQDEIKWGQPLIDTIKDTWLLDEKVTDEAPIIEELINFMEPRLYLLYVGSLVLSLIVVMIICFPRQQKKEIDELIQQERAERLRKLESTKFIGDKRNPLYWLVKGTYVRMGHPFKRLYVNFWIDVIWVSVAIFLMLLGAINFIDTYWLFNYLAITIWFILWFLDGSYIVRIKHSLSNFVQNRRSPDPEVSPAIDEESGQ